VACPLTEQHRFRWIDGKIVNKALNPRRLSDVAGYRMKWVFQDEGRGAYTSAMAGSREATAAAT
jgi:hypothetical protein